MFDWWRETAFISSYREVGKINRGFEKTDSTWLVPSRLQTTSYSVQHGARLERRVRWGWLPFSPCAPTSPHAARSIKLYVVKDSIVYTSCWSSDCYFHYLWQSLKEKTDQMENTTKQHLQEKVRMTHLSCCVYCHVISFWDYAILHHRYHYLVCSPVLYKAVTFHNQNLRV